MREKKRNKGSSQGQAQAQLKEGAEERERYVGWGPAVPHSIQGHGEPPPHTDSGLQGRLCAGFLPTVEVSRDKDTDHFNTCGCMLPFIPSQPRGHLGTLLPLQTWTNLVMSNTVITQGKKCLLAAWEWVCPSVQRRQKKGKKAQSSRSGESGREQGSREKAALLTVPKVPTIHQQGISSPHDPELGNNCRPNQHDLQTHSHAHSRWGCLPGTPHSHCPLTQRLEAGKELKHTPKLPHSQTLALTLTQPPLTPGREDAISWWSRQRQAVGLTST